MHIDLFANGPGGAAHSNLRHRQQPSVTRGRRTQHQVVTAAVRVDISIHKQVHYGEQIKLVGSSKQLGEWDVNRGAQLAWNDGDVWRTSLELEPGSDVHFKFVTTQGEHGASWENCHDRQLQVLDAAFSVNAQWDVPDLDIQHSADAAAPSNQHEAQQQQQPPQTKEDTVQTSSSNGSSVTDDRLAHNQWQGRDVTFMKSNEHSRDRQGKWDTSGLEGPALHIVSRDEKAANWLAKMESVKALLVDQAGPEKKPELKALAAAYVYLQWINTGAILCVEGGGHHRPNRHAELSRMIFRSLERVIGDPASAPVRSLLARRMHPKLPSFTEAYTASTPLTRIRDIAHRNDIPHELKQEIKHTIQNKLHRNAGPEDLVATEQMMQRLEKEGGYSEDFLSEFRTFLTELRDFFNASSFSDMLEGLRPSLDDADKQAIDVFMKAKLQLDSAPAPSMNNVMDALHSVTTISAILSAGLASGIRNDAPDHAMAMRQKWRLALHRSEDYAFVLLSQLSNLIEAKGGAAGLAEGQDAEWAQPLGATLLGIRQIGLSGWESRECMALENELTEWQRLGEFSTLDNALRLKATLERAQRLTQSYTDCLLGVLPPMADSLGAALGIPIEQQQVFTEAEVRASVVFQLSGLLTTLAKAARLAGGCDEWDTLVAGTAVGELVEVDSLEAYEAQQLKEKEVVLLLRRASGDEELGAMGRQLRGVILCHSIPHLSHLGVRARQERVTFVTCEDDLLLDTSVRPLLGKTVLLQAGAQGVVLAEDDGTARAAGSSEPAATSNGAAASQPQSAQISKVKKPALIRLADATPEQCGAKAAACCQLEKVSKEAKAAFSTPKAAVVPFGVMDLAIEDAGKQKEFEVLLEQAERASAAEVDGVCTQLQELVSQLQPADAVLRQAAEELGGGGRAYVRSSANVEDMEGMSGAGLYESIPNVSINSITELGQAVAQVWASLYTRRAVITRRAAGVKQADASMAVLLMEMLAPELSFVLHTASPLDRDPSVLHAEVAPGLGETLASGTRGSAWALTVDKASGAATATSFANFSSALAAATGRAASQQAGHSPLIQRVQDYSRQALSNSSDARQQLGGRFARLGVALEEAFGGPQDVEGAVVGETIYVVQSRPQP